MAKRKRNTDTNFISPNAEREFNDEVELAALFSGSTDGKQLIASDSDATVEGLKNYDWIDKEYASYFRKG